MPAAVVFRGQSLRGKREKPGRVMRSLFERLGEEELNVRKELDELRAEIVEAEEHLVRLTITRDTLLSLVDDTPKGANAASSDGSDPSDGEEPQPTNAEAAESAPSSEPLDLVEGRRRMLALLEGTEGPLKVDDITEMIGEASSRRETTRSRLKKLAREARVVEGPTGWFAITRPAASTSDEPHRQQ
ncbi:hypothetical protein OG898_15860 [Streptomyces sp. NBC_00193]|uniref:hypothetical protein n=1 Tax=Streptomyces sp. NBC_00193 TaxID=2975675 RepID=UPI00224E220C|nr:hypothetical protein [Streptomyces sp. NBC_00193]MCX5297944.1 hypothetical protein [Streptomyces sp. NBC_00193]